MPPPPDDAAFLGQTFDTRLLLELIAAKQVFVAVDCYGAAVGFIIISHKSGCAYIEEVDVLQSHGRQGIGKALIERSYSWAKDNGFSKIFLRTAANVPWNAPMYARLGFSVTAQSNWSDEMHHICASEKSKGLPVQDRVFMQLSL